MAAGPRLKTLGRLALACAALASTGCQDKPAPPGFEAVRVGSTRFELELAADEATRVKGLGGRNEIPENGGMLFVFPTAMPLAFVMRDCPIAIDVAFLDGSGRVLRIHEMKPEPARQPGESMMAYENRLPRYESGFPAQFAIETRGGRLAEVGLKEGDRPGLDVDRLKKTVR